MKTLKCITAGIALSALMFSVSADNITISDGRSNTYDWHGVNEDNEVEPSCLHGQEWDLEALLLNGTTLTVVSGYDLMNGVPAHNVSTGDLFVDIAGFNENGYIYDYVYDINWKTGNYELYEIDATRIEIITMTPEDVWNASSNPLSYTPGSQTSLMSGNLNYLAGIQSGSALTTATGDAYAGTLLGTIYNNKHNIASVDVSRFAGQEATFHLTMSCGNDNLMGHSNIPVPEPGTVSLMLLGLISLGGCLFSRKNK